MLGAGWGEVPGLQPSMSPVTKDRDCRGRVLKMALKSAQLSKPTYCPFLSKLVPSPQGLDFEYLSETIRVCTDILGQLTAVVRGVPPRAQVCVASWEPGKVPRACGADSPASCRGLKHQGTPVTLESKQQPRLTHCSGVMLG